MRTPARSSPLPTLSAARRTRRASLFALAGSLLVAGCGQRGPLYLPENAPPPRRSRPAPQPESEERSR